MPKTIDITVFFEKCCITTRTMRSIIKGFESPLMILRIFYLRKRSHSDLCWGVA